MIEYGVAKEERRYLLCCTLGRAPEHMVPLKSKIQNSYVHVYLNGKNETY
jgi:hypothetical protein